MKKSPHLFVDHRGGIRELPAQRSPHSRAGIHGVLVCDNALLLIQPPGGNWLELPGGGIEAGESPTQALLRELREEAGIHMGSGDIAARSRVRIATRYYAANHDEYWLYDQRFRLLWLHQRPALRIPAERGHERQWVTLSELSRKPVHHLHRLGIDRLLQLHNC